jgi:hypothetical protein
MKSNLLSISAVSKQSTLAFIKIISAASVAFMENSPLSSSIKSDLRSWNADASEFIKRFNLDKKAFSRIISQLQLDKVNLVDEIGDVMVGVREAHRSKELIKELDLSKLHLDFLKCLISVTLGGSETAVKNLYKNISKLGDPKLSALFMQETELDQSDLVAELSRFCKNVFKKPEQDLNVEDKNKLKAKNPELYKEYLKLLRDINEVTKQAVSQFVRNSGQQLVKATELVRYLKTNKIRSKVPEGFNGWIDETGAYYNTNKVKLEGAITGRLEANPKYDPTTDDTYVFLHYPLFGSGQPQRIYTVNYRKGKVSKKFNAVGALIKDLPAARKKWLHELKTGKHNEADTVAALILELIYETSARIGTAGQSGQGISTLLVKNYTGRGQGYFTLNYLGKSGVKQNHKILTNRIETKLLKELLESLTTGKKPNDLIMTVNKGRTEKHINGTYVNKYLRSLGVDPSVTLHKFRHARGSIVAQAQLDKAPSFKNASEAEVNKWFIEAMKKVGSELGHVSGDKVTATTAIQNYIDPQLIKDWFDKVGVRPGSVIQNALNKAGKD